MGNFRTHAFVTISQELLSCTAGIQSLYQFCFLFLFFLNIWLVFFSFFFSSFSRRINLVYVTPSGQELKFYFLNFILGLFLGNIA